MLNINKPILLTNLYSDFLDYNYKDLYYRNSVNISNCSRLINSLFSVYDSTLDKKYHIYYIDKSKLHVPIESLNKLKDRIMNLQPQDKIAIEFMKELLPFKEFRNVNIKLNMYSDEENRQRYLNLIEYALDKLNKMKNSNELIIMELSCKHDLYVKFNLMGCISTKKMHSKINNLTIELSEKDKIYTFSKSTPKYKIINYFNSLVHCLFANKEGVQ
ncbi:hypothetical protein ACT6CD_08700 [Campylobacter coli]|uniref:hypothetical protein n=1 Tax=Campylobacter coli TaxID=195 RepID=UPI004033DFBD